MLKLETSARSWNGDAGDDPASDYGEPGRVGVAVDWSCAGDCGSAFPLPAADDILASDVSLTSLLLHHSLALVVIQSSFVCSYPSLYHLLSATYITMRNNKIKCHISIMLYSKFNFIFVHKVVLKTIYIQTVIKYLLFYLHLIPVLLVRLSTPFHVFSH